MNLYRRLLVGAVCYCSSSYPAHCLTFLMKWPISRASSQSLSLPLTTRTTAIGVGFSLSP